MSRTCLLCNAKLKSSVAQRQPVTGGICDSCSRLMTTSGERFASRALVENIAAPALLMRGQPRQVFMANARALCLFGKDRNLVEGRRGGEVFDCTNAFTEAGCGKDPGCDDCRIKAAVVEALDSSRQAAHVFNPLRIRRAGVERIYDMEVSVERVGELALLRIDHYQPSAAPSTLPLPLDHHEKGK